MDEFVCSVYEESASKVSVLMGKHSKNNYTDLFPTSSGVSLGKIPLFGQNVHMYIETKSHLDNNIRRLVFVVFHPCM